MSVRSPVVDVGGGFVCAGKLFGSNGHPNTIRARRLRRLGGGLRWPRG